MVGRRLFNTTLFDLPNPLQTDSSRSSIDIVFCSCKRWPPISVTDAARTLLPEVFGSLLGIVFSCCSSEPSARACWIALVDLIPFNGLLQEVHSE
ncbi:hypothetical protein NL676_029580 [Syzygium grande]|nr:hypothetical protein NL676_029580 [Syzygium grande]